MKLLFSLGNGIYPYKVGGMEIFNYYLIKALKNKFDVHYTSTRELDIKGSIWEKTLSIKHIKFFSPLQVLVKLLFKPGIKKVVLSYSAAHWLVWYLYTCINTILKREYYIIIHYGDEAPKGNYNVYKNFFKNAKKVIAVSEDIKRNYDKLYNINCEVLYPLVPFKECTTDKATLRHKYNIPINAFLITMVGSVKDMKNPDTLVKAISLFNREELERFNIHIAYAGTGNMIKTLKDIAQNNDLADRVHFLGFVPKETVNEVFKMSDAYTIASDFEGTSVSLLEAMYNKIPILASNAPGINDMVKDNYSALMFEIKNENELKKQIQIILKDNTVTKIISTNAYNDFISKYRYEDMIDRYTTIFKE